jgi:hypothetical protein
MGEDRPPETPQDQLRDLTDIQETLRKAGQGPVAHTGPMPDEELLRGLLEQTDAARVNAGLPSIHGGDQSDEVAMQNEALGQRIAGYLDTDRPLNTQEQLDFLSSFWDQLGYTMPDLSEPQRARLQTSLESYPHMRIITTPINSDPRQNLSHRRLIAERAKTMKQLDNDPLLPALSVMDSSTFKDESATQARYAINQDGATRFVSRADYLDFQLEAGRAIRDANGNLWSLCLITPNLTEPENFTKIAEIHSLVGQSLSPEAVIGLGIMHAANGNEIRTTQLTNEFFIDEEPTEAGKSDTQLYVTAIDTMLEPNF